MFAPNLLTHARFLITGGGSGLGFLMTRACAELGATVYICGRREAVLAEAAAQLGGLPGLVVPMTCDIKSGDAVEAMLDRIWADGGALTGLVNNAAGNFISRTEDISMRGFDAIADIVFRGTFQLTHACGRRWLAEGAKASVLSILATWIWNGGPYVTASAMSKAGIHAMTQSLAVEWGGRGIRLNAVCPGAFPTEGATKRLNPGEEDSFVANPMGRIGRPDELANLVIYLMSPGAEFINGQTIAIDGAGWQANGQNFANLAGWTDDQWASAKHAARTIDARDKQMRESATAEG